MQAVVLVAGEGRRLQPLTHNRPKSMLPIGRRPLLERILETISESGIDDIVLVVGHKRERIQNYFGNGSDWGLSIRYVVQDQLLGTGDALLQAESVISEDFIVINGDRLVDATLLEDLRERFLETGDACIGVTSVDNPSEYGVVTTEGDRVVGIREKPPAHSVSSNMVNVGAYAFGPEIFAAIRRTNTYGELALTDTLDEYITDHPLRAVRYYGPWHELSFPWDLLALNAKHLAESVVDVDDSAIVHETATVTAPSVVGSQSVLQPGARALQSTVVGRNVSVGANAVVTNSILLDDVTVRPGAVVTDSIVGSGATVGQSSSLVGDELDITYHGEVIEDVQFGCLLGDRTTVGGGVFVGAGSIVGNGVTVEGGTSVDGHVPDGAYVSRG